MSWNDIKSLLLEHRGKFIGGLIGLAIGILVMLIGFWWTLFLCICVFIGYTIGKRFDEDDEVSMTDVIERYLTGRQR